MLAVTHDQATQSRFARTTQNGKRIWRSVYFGPPPSPASSSSLLPERSGVTYVDPLPGEKRAPQAFLIQQEAGATVHPHFHFVDQFQVVAAGSGLLGRHALAPLSVHFSAACTGYGPIEPGEQGLSYFTFRASADETGAQYLPGAKAQMRPGKRRNVIVDQILITASDLLADRTLTTVDVFRKDPDGLAVMMYRVAPGQTIECMRPDASQGITLLVAAGELRLENKAYPEWSCCFIDPQESGVELHAGKHGADILALRYPQPSETSAP